MQKIIKFSPVYNTDFVTSQFDAEVKKAQKRLFGSKKVSSCVVVNLHSIKTYQGNEKVFFFFLISQF